MIGRLWQALWFQPASPRTLAAVRIVVAAQALWMVLSRDPAGVVQLPALIWEGVDPAHRLRFLLVPGVPALETALWVGAAACLACVLAGVGTRVCGVIAAVILYHQAPLQSLLAVESPWGKGFTIATLALPILACSPCEDRWSLVSRGRPASAPPSAYGWPVTVIRLLVAQIYLFSALAKLRSAGLGWISVDSVRTHLLVFDLAGVSVSPPLSAWIAAHPALCYLLAAGTVVFELIFVTAVFVRPFRRPLMIAAALFHAGLWTTLGFRSLNLPHLLLFLDFENGPPQVVTPTGGDDRSASARV